MLILWLVLIRLFKPQGIEEPKDEDYAQAKWDIAPVLLHDILLMETRSYTKMYKAFKKREMERLTNVLKKQIEEIQDSNKEEDIAKQGLLEQCLQDSIDHDDNDAVSKLLAKYQ